MLHSTICGRTIQQPDDLVLRAFERGTSWAWAVHSLAVGFTTKSARPNWLEKRKSFKLTENPKLPLLANKNMVAETKEKLKMAGSESPGRKSVLSTVPSWDLVPQMRAANVPTP